MQKKKEISLEVTLLGFIEKISRPFLVFCFLAIIGYGGYLAYSAYADKQEESAQEKLFVLQKKVQDKNEELAKAESEKNRVEDKKNGKSVKKDLAKKDKKNPDVQPKTPELLTQHFSDAIHEYEAFIKEQAGSKAAGMAAIQLAGLAVTYKDLPRAERVLREVKVKKNHLFSGLIHVQLGSVLMDQKKFGEAAEYFSLVVDDKKQTYLHPHALLRLGASYLAGGDFVKAEATFSRLETEHPSTQAANEAKTFKRLAALKKGSKS